MMMKNEKLEVRGVAVDAVESTELVDVYKRQTRWSARATASHSSVRAGWPPSSA